MLKFQDYILIYIWFRAKWLKNCCNNRPTLSNCKTGLPRVGHWLQQIFSHLALNQKRIEISAWNFQNLFILCLRKFDKKFWPLLNQPASHGPFRLKLWMSLVIVFVEIFQKEKNWWGSGPIGVTSWKDFSISLKKWHFWFFWKACGSTFTMSTVNRYFWKEMCLIVGCLLHNN